MAGGAAISWNIDQGYVLIDLSNVDPLAAGDLLQLFNDPSASAEISMLAVLDGDQDLVVDGSSLTARLVVYARAGRDTFRGGSGDDFFAFDVAALTSADVIAGNAGFDTILFNTGGVLSTGAFSQVTGIDALVLSRAGNTVNATNELVAGSQNGVFTVVDGIGNDTVDASAVTNGIRISFSSVGGDDRFSGGSAGDYFLFTADALTSLDTVIGGAGFDTLIFSTSGTVAAGALANVTGIDAVHLHEGGNNLTLTNGFSGASDAGMVAIFDGTGNDVINAAMSVAPVAIYSAGGSDVFIGGTGNDYFSFEAAQLTSDDQVIGGVGFDVIAIRSAGAVGASAFNGVNGIDALVLGDASITANVSNSLVGGSEYLAFAVVDGLGNQTVDASGVTNGVMIAFYSKGGDDTFIGGNGNDFFAFGETLTAADSANGGAGFDALYVSGGATLNASAFVGVTNVEALVLGAGTNVVTLPATLISSSGVPQFAVVDGPGGNVVDASAADSSKVLAFYGAGGADTFKAGAGNDYFVLPDSGFAQIEGGDGLDRIAMTSAFAGKTLDLPGVAAKISGIEIISLTGASGVSASISGAAIAAANSAGNFLYVTGGSDDEVVFADDGWRTISAGQINAAVDLAMSFVQFHNDITGSDLYVSDQIGFLIFV